MAGKAAQAGRAAVVVGAVAGGGATRRIPCFQDPCTMAPGLCPVRGMRICRVAGEASDPRKPSLEVGSVTGRTSIERGFAPGRRTVGRRRRPTRRMRIVLVALSARDTADAPVQCLSMATRGAGGLGIQVGLAVFALGGPSGRVGVGSGWGRGLIVIGIEAGETHEKRGENYQKENRDLKWTRPTCSSEGLSVHRFHHQRRATGCVADNTDKL